MHDKILFWAQLLKACFFEEWHCQRSKVEFPERTGTLAVSSLSKGVLTSHLAATNPRLRLPNTLELSTDITCLEVVF
jgi:hypothetical protein